jgi:hypothetical protein
MTNPTFIADNRQLKTCLDQGKETNKTFIRKTKSQIRTEKNNSKEGQINRVMENKDCKMK